MAKLSFDKILAKLADKAVSSAGREAALEIEPSADAAEVQRMLRETQEAESITLRAETFPLVSFSDVRAELARLRSGAGLSCAELLRMARLLKAARRAAKGIRRDEDGALELLPRLAEGLVYDDFLIEDIDRAILSEEQVADAASRELASIRRKITRENEAIREKLGAILRNRELAKCLQDAIVTMRGGRHVIPVKQEYRSAISGLVHGQSASGATVFVEPMSVVEANNRLRELEEEERREIERILMMLSDELRPFAEDMEYDVQVLSRLDVIFAKAALGISMKAHRAEPAADFSIDIRKGRHPLIPEGEVIPVSVNSAGENRCLIITGPNTGGKTVTLKLVGLLAMMNQSGLFIPAEAGSSLPIFSGVFADIGDEQSIEQSLSTFSSHMKNIVFILRRAEAGALILLDELGAGTDPEEGSSLALAILEALTSRDVKIFATTHYSEIKSHAMTAEGYENACMEFDADSLRPTYKLIMGVAGSSNAFLISKRLGLKGEIIERARKFMDEERLQFDALLGEAERTKVQAQKELARAKDMEERAREVDRRARALEAELEEKRARAMENARQEAYEIVRKAREETEEIIEEVKRIRKMGEGEATKAIDKARRGLNARRDVLDGSRRRTPQKHMERGEIVTGAVVRLLNLGADAVVLRPPDQKGMAEVQAGVMKLSVHYTDIGQGRQAAVQPKGRSGRKPLGARNVPLSLNLLGKTVEEAVAEAEKYIDDAVIAGRGEVTLIHGKGTGALRSGLWEYLKGHPHVESFRLGAFGEGDAGVTVVALK